MRKLAPLGFLATLLPQAVSSTPTLSQISLSLLNTVPGAINLSLPLSGNPSPLSETLDRVREANVLVADADVDETFLASIVSTLIPDIERAAKYVRSPAAITENTTREEIQASYDEAGSLRFAFGTYKWELGDSLGSDVGLSVAELHVFTRCMSILFTVEQQVMQPVMDIYLWGVNLNILRQYLWDLKYKMSPDSVFPSLPPTLPGLLRDYASALWRVATEETVKPSKEPCLGTKSMGYFVERRAGDSVDGEWERVGKPVGFCSANECGEYDGSCIKGLNVSATTRVEKSVADTMEGKRSYFLGDHADEIVALVESMLQDGIGPLAGLP